MSSDFSPAATVAGGLWKGCFAGIGLAIFFFAVSGCIYLSLTLLALPRSIHLLLTFAGGPVLGTIIVTAVLYARSRHAAEGFRPSPGSRGSADMDDDISGPH